LQLAGQIVQFFFELSATRLDGSFFTSRRLGGAQFGAGIQRCRQNGRIAICAHLYLQRVGTLTFFNQVGFDTL
jgi:hypothetical protein